MQWTVGSGGNGHWYAFINTAVDWHGARAAALASSHLGMQGYLATITSVAENSFVSAAVAGSILAWAGASDAAVEGQWRWIDGPEAGLLFWSGGVGGTAVGNAIWNGGEPNNVGGGEDYLQLNWSSQRWNDHGGPGVGIGQRNAYVIEYSTVSMPVPEPMTLALVLSALLASGGLSRRRQG